MYDTNDYFNSTGGEEADYSNKVEFKRKCKTKGLVSGI